MGNIVLTVVIGVATGLAASALFWWLQAKLLRPKMIICPDLRLVRAVNSNSEIHFVCEFTLINRSRFAAADISIKANFTVPGLLSEHGVFDFYMRDLVVPWMEPGKGDHYIIGSEYLLHESDQKEYYTRLENRLGKSLERLNMRELVEACAGSYVTVFVASNHTFSGARAFKRAIFTEKDFILASNSCERADCCQVDRARWSFLSALAKKLLSLVSTKD